MGKNNPTVGRELDTIVERDAQAVSEWEWVVDTVAEQQFR